MHWQYTPYIWFLIVPAAITAPLAIYAWRQRAVAGAIPAIVLLTIAMAWSLLDAVIMAGSDLFTKLFWIKLEYLGIVTSPIASLALALQYTGQEQWLSPRRLATLSIVPLLTVALLWSNEFHGLMYRHVYLDTSGPFPTMEKTYGPWFWIFLAYSYLLILIAIFLLFRKLLRSPPLYRGQALILLISLSIPLVWSTLFVLHLNPLRRLDLTSVAFALSGIVMTGGLFRFRIFDIVPIARDTVIEGMSDGVIVLDAQDRIVDLNPAARNLLGSSSHRATGLQARQVFSDWPDLIQILHADAEIQGELIVDQDDIRRYYNAYLSPLADRRGRLIGRVVVLHNITERKQAEEELRSLSITDPLTGLANRRKFFEVLEVEVHRAYHQKLPLSLIMLDMDDLKHINDTLGHQTGDEALQKAAQAISRISRETDLIARYGGDEFVLLLPHTCRAGAEGLARRVLDMIRQIKLSPEVILTMSAGVATLQVEEHESGDSLLARADRALYLAKEAGKGLVKSDTKLVEP